MSEERPPDDPARRRSARRSGLAVAVAAVLVAALFGTGLMGLSRMIGDAVVPATERAANYSGTGGPEVLLQIQPGDSTRDIGERMQRADIVKSADAFLGAAALDERAGRLQPGLYRLRRQISGQDALAALLDPAARAEARVTLPEGLRVEQSLRTLSKGTGIPIKEFRAALTSGEIGLPAISQGRAEGFLFPATYSVPPGASAADVLRQTTARFAEAAARVGLLTGGKHSPYEIVTIASLVEAEAGTPQDFGKVARVIYNRLETDATNGLLQIDATVNYAPGRDLGLGLTPEDLEVDSPYNTRKYPGLPPGPIESPGDEAIAAAARPTPGEWVYYVTVDLDTGETKFTDDYDEFLRFKNVELAQFCERSERC